MSHFIDIVSRVRESLNLAHSIMRESSSNINGLNPLDSFPEYNPNASLDPNLKALGTKRTAMLAAIKDLRGEMARAKALVRVRSLKDRYNSISSTLLPGYRYILSVSEIPANDDTAIVNELPNSAGNGDVIAFISGDPTFDDLTFRVTGPGVDKVHTCGVPFLYYWYDKKWNLLASYDDTLTRPQIHKNAKGTAYKTNTHLEQFLREKPDRTAEWVIPWPDDFNIETSVVSKFSNKILQKNGFSIPNRGRLYQVPQLVEEDTLSDLDLANIELTKHVFKTETLGVDVDTLAAVGGFLTDDGTPNELDAYGVAIQSSGQAVNSALPRAVTFALPDTLQVDNKRMYFVRNENAYPSLGYLDFVISDQAGTWFPGWPSGGYTEQDLDVQAALGIETLKRLKPFSFNGIDYLALGNDSGLNITTVTQAGGTGTAIALASVFESAAFSVKDIKFVEIDDVAYILMTSDAVGEERSVKAIRLRVEDNTVVFEEYTSFALATDGTENIVDLYPFSYDGYLYTYTKVATSSSNCLLRLDIEPDGSLTDTLLTLGTGSLDIVSDSIAGYMSNGVPYIVYTSALNGIDIVRLDIYGDEYDATLDEDIYITYGNKSLAITYGYQTYLLASYDSTIDLGGAPDVRNGFSTSYTIVDTEEERDIFVSGSNISSVT